MHFHVCSWFLVEICLHHRNGGTAVSQGDVSSLGLCSLQDLSGDKIFPLCSVGALVFQAPGNCSNLSGVTASRISGCLVGLCTTQLGLQAGDPDSAEIASSPENLFLTRSCVVPPLAIWRPNDGRAQGFLGSRWLSPTGHRDTQ